jgi:hypothetical protein
MTWIPSDEDLARASRKMKEQSRGLDQVRENFVQTFKDRCRLYRFTIMPQGDNAFLTIVFFEKDKDLEACKKNGLDVEMMDCIYEELERAGRGTRSEITVRFEWDSDENVERKYHGNYFDRLR